MKDPVHHQSVADRTRQEIDELTNLQQRLLGSKLAKKTPAAVRTQLEQLQARVDLANLKSSVAIAGMLVSAANQVFFQNSALDIVELRGALLDVMDKAGDPDVVAAYRLRDAKFQASKRRQVHGVRTFVAAARPSAELVAAAKSLGLRHDPLAGGFTGRSELDALVALGRDYTCSVRIDFEREMCDLVSGGVVDEAVLELVAMTLNCVSDGKSAPTEAASETAVLASLSSGGDAEDVQDTDAVEAEDRPLVATPRVPLGVFRRHPVAPVSALPIVEPGHEDGTAHKKIENVNDE